ncbi:MAG: BMP family ABC transporter substrate-binding protein [Bacillota bacterium]
MKKKILSLVLISVMVLTLVCSFVACNMDADTEFKIGVLHIGSVDDTSGYTYAHQSGIEYMIEELGLDEATQVVYSDELDDGDSAAINAAIETLIAAGCNMIIGTSFGYCDEMQTYAEANPEIIFSHATGTLDTYGTTDNMNNFFGSIYEARYLAGVAAGLQSLEIGNNNIGYVAAYGTDVAECSSGINAFALGAQSVNPDAVVKVKVLDSWFDMQNESDYAYNLLVDEGCGIVTHHCDTSGPSLAAEAEGKYSIGYNSDMANEVTDASSVLTSVVWNWGVYYKAAAEAAMACFDIDDDGIATFSNTDAWVAFGNYYGSYADGLFGLADYSSVLTDEMVDIMDAYCAYVASTGIIANSDCTWDVFTNYALTYSVDAETGAVTISEVDRALTDNEGNAVTVTASDITGSMPYFVAGVTLIV